MKRAIIRIMAVVMLVGSLCVSAASAVTVPYEFLPDQSTLHQSGGAMGRSTTYSVEGEFELIVDFDGGIASFGPVDATYGQVRSLGDLFNMAELVGTLVSNMEIDFEGQTIFGTDILLRLSFIDDLVHLTGGYADLFPDGYTNDLDAVAVVVPEPTTFLLLCVGGLIMTAELPTFGSRIAWNW